MSSRYAHIIQAIKDCEECKKVDPDGFQVYPCRKHWDMLVKEVSTRTLAKILGIPEDQVERFVSEYKIS